MNLAQSQQLFWDLLQGEERALEAFVGSSGLGAAERVAIYTNMVLHRQVDALRDTFPKVAAALGDSAFFEMASAYVRAHPSEHPDLGQLGRHLASFLNRPDLRDLARLEWTRSEVFEAAFADSLSADQFEALARDPARFMAHPIKLIPALRLLELDHDIEPLWEGTATSSGSRAAWLVIWRAGFEVFHVAVEADEARAVSRAIECAPLGEVCAAFARPQRAVEALRSWLAEGWVASPPPLANSD